MNIGKRHKLNTSGGSRILKCVIGLVAVVSTGALVFFHYGVGDNDAISADIGASPTISSAAEPRLRTPVITESEVPVSSAKFNSVSTATAAVSAMPVFNDRSGGEQFNFTAERPSLRTAGSATTQKSPTNSEPADPKTKLSPSLAVIAAAGGDDMINIIVRYADHSELFDTSRVQKLGGKVVRSFENFKMRAIELPASEIEALAIDPDVKMMSLDSQLRTW